MADPTVASDPLLINVALYLGATVIAVPLFKRLGLGSILGYLAAGAAIGPYGLAMFTNVEEVRHIAEFGVVLLLFVIGLELQPSRLWRLRSEIFGLGATQVLLSGLLFAGIAYALGMPLGAASVIGLALALSSTAFGVQILRDEGALKTKYGDRAFSILLFQDIAVVPLLALTAFIGGKGEGIMGRDDVMIAVVALCLLYLIGKYGIRYLFRLLAIVRAHEVFAAGTLLVVAVAALMMEWAGLSMALGAFMAGVLLADSEFRHQIESDIEPFRVLLLGLFFVAVGMSVDWGLTVAYLHIVLGGAILLFVLKMATLFCVARAAGSSREDALKIGATLGQAGEFGFVVFSLAAGDRLINFQQEALLTAAVALSMALTPIAMIGVKRWLAKYAPETEEGIEAGPVSKGAGAIIIAGFGRTGQVIARIMRLRGYEVTLIDNAPRRIRLARSFGSEVFYGDATKLDVLTAAGADEAAAIFYCIDDREGARNAFDRVKQRFPNTLVLFSTYDRFSELELRQAGAEHVRRETHAGAVSLARVGLEQLGEKEVADELIEEYRKQDQELLRLQIEYGMQEGAEKLRQKYSLQQVATAKHEEEQNRKTAEAKKAEVKKADAQKTETEKGGTEMSVGKKAEAEQPANTQDASVLDSIKPQS